MTTVSKPTKTTEPSVVAIAQLCHRHAVAGWAAIHFLLRFGLSCLGLFVRGLAPYTPLDPPVWVSDWFACGKPSPVTMYVYDVVSQLAREHKWTRENNTL